MTERFRSHNVLDLWMEKVVKREMNGYVELVRYVDDFVVMVQYKKQTCKLAYKWINRRSQEKSMNWMEFIKYIKQFPLPKPQIKHNIYVLGGNV